MISRHVACEPRNDDYRRLANYIADAGHQGEKCLMIWCAGCWSNDDEYQLAIQEVEDSQALNLRTAKEKTYHLLISFRPEDEAKLTPKIFREIETEFAKVLGYEEHQRHCGVHRNTDNIHLHIAFNMIDKERSKRHEPYRDFKKRDRLCRELELRYGLTIDNGREPEKDTAVNDAALAYEAHSGQESFFSYAQRHKSDILTALERAVDWVGCHQIFSQFGLALKVHGNGLIVQSLYGQHSIKASGLDRSISKSKLEKRFGHFQAQEVSAGQSVKPTSEYAAVPLQKDPDRNGLYQRYQAGIKKRRTEIDELRQQEKRLSAAISRKWDDRYKSIIKLPMTRRHRAETMKVFKAKKRQDFAALRRHMKEKRDEVVKRYPYSNWSKFLRYEAGRGNESALAVLRSRKAKEAAQVKPGPESANSPNLLAAVDQIRKVVLESGLYQLKSLRYEIDGQGTILFKLPDGGMVRDTGKELHFSAGNEKAGKLAAALAESRWGRPVELDGNCLRRPGLSPQRQSPQLSSPTVAPDISRSSGMSR